jgi:cyclase
MKDFSKPFSRRTLLSGTASLSALYAASSVSPLRALAQSMGQNSRVAQTPIADKGFASVRKVGDGVYATLSDRTKGLQARCNGGILVGRDGALVIEGFQTTVGAAFQLDTLRTITRVPLRAAINTHWHFDHTLGNSVYAAAGAPIWAHKDVPSRMMQVYPKWQTMDLEGFLAPWEARVRSAKTDSQREHAKSDVEGVTGMFVPVSESVLAFPNHGLDPAKMPMAIDLGGLNVTVEAFVGHTDTDLIIRVKEQNIVFTGDLLVNGQYPVNINGYPTSWRAALATFATFDKDTLFIPGHGAACGQEGVAFNRAMFDDIAEQAEKMYKAGVPAQEAAERYVVPEKYKNLRQFSWGFAFGRTIEQFYAEWSGKPVEVLSYS